MCIPLQHSANTLFQHLDCTGCLSNQKGFGFIFFPLVFHRENKKQLLFPTVYKVCTFTVRVANPFLLEPVCFSLKCQAINYQVNMGKNSEMHKLGNHLPLFCNDLNQQYCARQSTGCTCCRKLRKTNIPTVLLQSDTRMRLAQGGS